MKITYYPDTDSLYIELLEQPSAESREVSEGVVLDYDAKGCLVGIDIDNASKKVNLKTLTLNKLPTDEHTFVADLEGANLRGAILINGILWVANLFGGNATLWVPSLIGGNLFGVYLYMANLLRDKQQGADMEKANLKGVNLLSANLDVANLNSFNVGELHCANLISDRRLFSDRITRLTETEKQEVHPKITVAHPEVIAPLQWSTVDVFLYLRDYRELVQAEIRRQQQKANIDYSLAAAEFPKSLPIGCSIKILLESTTLRVNPSEVTIHWYEPYNRLSFRISPIDDKKDGYSASLDVDVFADDLPAASMTLAIAVNSRSSSEHIAAASSDATWYENIFASYAREDLELVKHLKERYEALGMHMFVDLDDLLSGVEWEKVLVNKIRDSDLFQLFWSENARQSEYVSVEWKHALRVREIKGGRFIRPLYWDDPIPKVPDELADINFRKIKFVKT